MNVENINSIEKLEKLGAEGEDVSLCISLGDYKIAWIKGKEETLFIYATGNDQLKFDRASISNDLDVYNEFDWVEWESLYSFFGVSEKDFKALPLEIKISNIINYYGYLNVFGDSYWEGFEIEGLEQ